MLKRGGRVYNVIGNLKACSTRLATPNHSLRFQIGLPIELRCKKSTEPAFVGDYNFLRRMNTSKTHLGPREHCLVLGALILSALVLLAAPHAVLGAHYQCLLHRVTGLRCPFCGMTRDFILMFHGAAPQNNPGSLVLAIALYIAYPVWLAWAAARRPARLLINRDKLVRALMFAMLALFISNNLALWRSTCSM